MIILWKDDGGETNVEGAGGEVLGNCKNSGKRRSNRAVRVQMKNQGGRFPGGTGGRTLVPLSEMGHRRKAGRKPGVFLRGLFQERR